MANQQIGWSQESILLLGIQKELIRLGQVIGAGGGGGGAVFTPTTNGLVPAPGTVQGYVLSDSGVWVAPAPTNPLTYWITTPTAGYVLTSTTALQKLFNGGAGGNGSINVTAGKKYRIYLALYIDNISSTSGQVFFNFLGTSEGTISIISKAARSSTFPVSISSTSTLTNAVLFTDMSFGSASTSTGLRGIINGIINITTSGTLIPGFRMGVAAPAIVQPGTYFEITELGDISTDYNGNWD